MNPSVGSRGEIQSQIFCGPLSLSGLSWTFCLSVHAGHHRRDSCPLLPGPWKAGGSAVSMPGLTLEPSIQWLVCMVLRETAEFFLFLESVYLCCHQVIALQALLLSQLATSAFRSGDLAWCQKPLSLALQLEKCITNVADNLKHKSQLSSWDPGGR